jgi:hypothetical protein
LRNTMSLTHFLIRTLTRLDDNTVSRVISTAAAQDEPTAPPPAEFRQGGARWRTRWRSSLVGAPSVFT